jgi:O-acetyl-ADP-ribose deacetylase
VIRVVRADPTQVRAEALVRSVGEDLEPCTAVDDRIGRGAGDGVLERLRSFGEVPIGAALVTPGGALPVPFLIHLVVRSMEEPVSEDRIARALRNALRQAAEWGLRTVAIPPIGTGAGNLDAEDAARVMCRVIREHCATSPVPEEVVLVVGNPYEEDAFTREAARPPSEEEG